MLKKYIYSSLLLITGVSYAMKRAVVEVTPKQDYKCYWVARYVHKRSDGFDETKKEKLKSFFEQQSALSQKVQEYHDSMEKNDLAVAKFLEDLLDKRIDDAYNDYFHLYSGAQYQIAFCLKHTPIASLLNKGKGTVVPLDTVKDIVFNSCLKSSVVSQGQVNEKQEYDYFPVLLPNVAEKEGEEKLSFASNLRGFTVLQLLFLSRQNDFVLEFKGMSSYSAKIIPGIEFISKAHPFKELLQKICKGSTDSVDGDVNLRHKLTADERKQLISLHHKVKHLDEWKAIMHALIGIDFRQPTLWERFKDRMLLAVPLCLVEGAIPHLIYKVTLGKITCALGIIPCCIISVRFIGHKLFPFLDSYNSQAVQLSDIFKDNVEKDELGSAFLGYSFIHYITTILGEYFLSYGKYTVGYSLGIGLYAARLCALLYGIFSTKADNKDYATFGKIALGNPLLRKNKKRRSFTVKDVVESDSEL